VSGEGSHLVLSGEFWKFIVILLAMVVATFGLVTGVQALSAWGYERKLQESGPSSSV
jgi:heme/copper-type cytochrome/quinol oxidase subunit 2